MANDLKPITLTPTRNRHPYPHLNQRYFYSLIMESQPDGFSIRIGPFHTMTPVAGNLETVPRTHDLDLCFSFEQ